MAPSEAAALFDSLQPATETDLQGTWTCHVLKTGHVLDDLLTSSYWHGKRVDNIEEVFPLVHRVPVWGDMRISPSFFPLELLLSMRPLLLVTVFLSPILMPLLAPLLRTSRPSARVRTMQFRGRLHASIVFDSKPIEDVFVRVNDETLLGWMNCKLLTDPFFFTITRERDGT